MEGLYIILEFSVYSLGNHLRILIHTDGIRYDNMNICMTSIFLRIHHNLLPRSTVAWLNFTRWLNEMYRTFQFISFFGVEAYSFGEIFVYRWDWTSYWERRYPAAVFGTITVTSLGVFGVMSSQIIGDSITILTICRPTITEKIKARHNWPFAGSPLFTKSVPKLMLTCPEWDYMARIRSHVHTGSDQCIIS